MKSNFGPRDKLFGLLYFSSASTGPAAPYVLAGWVTAVSLVSSLEGAGMQGMGGKVKMTSFLPCRSQAPGEQLQVGSLT